METFETRDKCGVVEAFIWDQLALSCGEFEGIKELSYANLLALHALVSRELNETYKVE